MKKGYSIFLIFILIAGLSSSSFIQPVSAEKKSVFYGFSDLMKTPFHSAAKAVGWDGTPSRFSGHTEPVQYKPFLSSWICQILVGEFGNILGTSSQDTFNASSLCKGRL